MPPSIAKLLMTAFIGWLVWRDMKRRTGVSPAIWIPTLWILVLGSRPVSVWMGKASEVSRSTESYAAGSPIDRMFWFALILLALGVLSRRPVKLQRLIAGNPVVITLALYWGMSVLWSDFPMVTLKRWIKELGHVLVALVVCTEEDPEESIQALVSRFAYFLVPFSVLYIKYFPHIGRSYNRWTWEYMYIGVAEQKNGLGMLSFVSGIYVYWELFILKLKDLEKVTKADVVGRWVLLLMTVYLVKISNSATSLVVLFLGIAIAWALGRGPFKGKPSKFEATFVTVLVVGYVADQIFGIREFIIVQVLGRDLSLTDRTEIWRIVLAAGTNPLLGAGYYSFWLGPRAEMIWADRPGINQSHNGYIEAYINGGLFAIGLLVFFLLWVRRSQAKAMSLDSRFGVFGYSIFAVALVHNYSEATFFRMSLLWFLMILLSFSLRAREAPKAGVGSLRKGARG